MIASPEELVVIAYTWLDTPWAHQGRIKHVGVDCIGLVGGVGVEGRVPEAIEWSKDQSLRRYGRAPNPDLLFNKADQYLTKQTTGAIQLADIFIMRMQRDIEPRHFAIVSQLNPIYIIHAYASAERVVENIYDADAGARTYARYRFRGI